MAVVRELITQFGFNVDQAGVNRAEGSINRLSGMLQGLAAFTSLRALAGVGDSMQSLEARIGMLPQTVGDVGAAFNEVSKHASDNRQSIAAYGAFYTKVGNAAKGLISDQKQLLQVTDTISQALVVGGATTMEAQSAMLQFGQALGSGVLQGDEFRSMAEAAPQYLDALSEAMEIPKENLKKMASEGKLTSKAVIEATLKMSSMFEEKFRRMPMTIGQATTIIGNKFSTMVGNMNRESQVVTNVANFLLRGFDKIEGGIKSFIDFVGGAPNAIKVLGIALAAIFGPMALGGLLSILGVVFSTAGLVVGGLILLGLAIDDVYEYMNGGESIFGAWIDKIKEGSEAFKMLAVVAIGVLSGIALRLAYTAGISALTWAANTAGAIASFAIASATALQSFGVMAMGFIRTGVLAASMYGGMAAASLTAGLNMAAAWFIALGPIGWVIAAIIAVGSAIYLLWTNWDTVTGFMGDKITWLVDKLKMLGKFMPNFSGDMSVNSTMMPQSAVAGSATGGAGANVNSTQIVNLTVPPGTPESQQAALKASAGTLFGEDSNKRTARDMAMVSG